jgi:DNA-binding LacI/PurR family transcriptional regulator
VAALGGLLPGLRATAVAALTADSLFVPPVGSFSIASPTSSTSVGLYSPPLRTVRQDFDRVGRVAVEALIRQVETGESEQILPLASELIVRRSTTTVAS